MAGRGPARRSRPPRAAAALALIGALALGARLITPVVAQPGPASAAWPDGSSDVGIAAAAVRELDDPSQPLGNRDRSTTSAAGNSIPPVRQPAASAGAVDVPACRYADEPAPHAGLDEWASTIVDTASALPPGYVPPDLVPVGRAGITGGGLVRAFVIDDLRALANAASAAGNPIAIQSAYRSRARQADVFAGWVASSGETEARRFSARPGHSEHQLGTAIDVRAAGGGAPWSGTFGTTRAGRWLAAHATEFGFVLSYPPGAEAATCYGAEAWHIRYVGRERANRIAASGLTLREWLWQPAGAGPGG